MKVSRFHQAIRCSTRWVVVGETGGGKSPGFFAGAKKTGPQENPVIFFELNGDFEQDKLKKQIDFRAFDKMTTNPR